MKLVTSAEMRGIEQEAIASGRVTGLELMERAGRGVVEAMLSRLAGMRAGGERALVLCGPGNNGGDGFVIARLLKSLGWELDVRLLGEAERLPPDAARNCHKFREIGDVSPLDRLPPDAAAGAVVVDALFGTGISRPLPAGIASLLAGLSGAQPKAVIAVDAPSGLCLDSGRLLGPACRADLTVTFHAAKPGHHLAEGPALCGSLAIADIGLNAVPDPAIRLIVDDADLDAADGLLKRGGHKYDHGHVLVLGGGPGKGGAARLAARAALRVGAGLVTLGVPSAAMGENAARLDAVMLRPVDGRKPLAEALKDRRLNALCLGPGLGIGAATREIVLEALASRRPLVLDADAITSFAGDPAALFGALHEGALLTPHFGEFSRLFPDIGERLDAVPTTGPAYSKVDAVAEAVERAGCAILFKGPDTVIGSPGRRPSIHSAAENRAVPWLATAGSGDVLAGLAAGLMARGSDPRRAAELAAWLHVECALAFGPGLIAEDLAEQVPRVLSRLAAGA